MTVCYPAVFNNEQMLSLLDSEESDSGENRRGNSAWIQAFGDEWPLQ